MNFIKIDTMARTHNNHGSKPRPPKASVSTNCFTLNSMAILELSKIHGSLEFALELYVSECENYVGFGTKPLTKKLMAIPKTIGSAEAKRRLKFDKPFGKKDIQLEVVGNKLVGRVN